MSSDGGRPGTGAAPADDNVWGICHHATARSARAAVTLTLEDGEDAIAEAAENWYNEESYKELQDPPES